MKRFYESFQKTGESFWKTVFMHKSQHALAVDVGSGGVGVDELIGSFQYAMAKFCNK